MTHPHDQAPAPLTAEVVAMVAQLRQRAIFAKAENTGTAQGDAWHFDGAADMLTALAAQLAERDAELARVTAERDSALAFEMLHISELEKLHPRIAALIEALTETAAILQAAVVAGKVRGGDSYRIGGVYLQTVSDALDAADAALTTNKGAAT